MAKPDPVLNFVEVRPKAGAIAPDVVVAVGPVELDWVDEFLSDREIRPNTKKAYLRQLEAFNAGASSSTGLRSMM